ncbi:MAG: Cys-tRNA(Pro) deacylase [Clostridia bacterium]|nr:Cys-tRNA(Pro) deacylase [Clostridia bacterium]
MNKTNAMRMLDKAKIPYEPKEYIPDENDLSGVHIAEQIGIPPQQCFKTIVTRGDKTGPVVFCIPADLEIDLKKAAKITGNKKVEPLHVKDLPQLTGYVRGACSPLGMKKKFPTYIHQTCNNFEKITVSAGVKGCQLLVKSNEIVSCIQATVCDLAAEKE